MESSPVMFESLPHSGVLPDQNSPFQSECLATALELLGVLREEAGILRRFAGAELLKLVPRKEYLVSELEWKLQSAQKAGEGFVPASDSFKALLCEIGELNTTNGVFIEKSLSYWRDLLSVLLPRGYGPAGKKAGWPRCTHRGLTFEREV
jgi:flagellar biosynthesis/type III secretory pathway chaperone